MEQSHISNFMSYSQMKHQDSDMSSPISNLNKWISIILSQLIFTLYLYGSLKFAFD